jgi:hypothetical protein
MAEGPGLIMIPADDLAKIASAVIMDHFASSFTSEQLLNTR